MSQKDDVNINFDGYEIIPEVTNDENARLTKKAKKSNLPKIYHGVHLAVIILKVITNATISVLCSL